MPPFKPKQLLYAVFLCNLFTATPISSLLPRPPTSNEFTCELIPSSHGRQRSYPKRNGDNGFSVKLEGQPEFYEPERTYTATLRSTHPVTFRGFALTAERADHSSTPAGSFKILNPWSTKKMELCNQVVTHSTGGKKVSAQFVWTAPPSGFGCVRIRASVIQKGSIWFRDDENLSFEICETSELPSSSDIPDCCACGHARYRMTFYGLWSPQTHPKNYPEFSTHWSNVIGAAHSEKYHIWDYGEYASDGVKKVAEWGWPNAVEDEIRGQGDSVLSVIKTRAQWPAYQPRNIREPPSSVFDVDSKRHLVSLLSMLGPSPDWNVGITKQSMCTETCGWEGEKTYDLVPWDAGTDSGVSYMSANSPTNPPDKIREVTSSDDKESPFYDPQGSPIPPVARIVITRLGIEGEQCGASPAVSVLSVQNENTRSLNVEPDENSVSCMFTEWSEWSQCGVTCGWGIKVRSKMLKLKLIPSASCENQIMEKEICRGAGQCENEDESTVCLYSDWSVWSSCTATCGKEALRFRTRSLKWPSEESNCHEPLKEMRFDCNTQPCEAGVVDGCTYGKWSDYMPCSASCGVGTTLRKRFASSGAGCESPQMETTKCMASLDCNPPVGFDVAVQCAYSPWTGWMPCPVTCGSGRTFRKRVLDSSPPDIHCDEVQMENTKCMTSQDCFQAESSKVSVESCSYSQWTDWMPCSTTCGEGETFRKRSLRPQSPESCAEVEKETIRCVMPPCTMINPSHKMSAFMKRKTCLYGTWTAWMPCSVTCGKGETLRKRFLKKSLDISRTCEEFEMETNICTVPCIDSPSNIESQHEAKTSQWSSCSVTCGKGKKFRTVLREGCSDLSSPTCVLTETERCAVNERCPIDCKLGEWSSWSYCAPCGATISRRNSDTRRASHEHSYQTRTRRRMKKPKFGGAACGPRKEKRRCACISENK